MEVIEVPRKPRIHYFGALYHVIVRGNNKAHIFEKEEEKENYTDIIKLYKKKYHFLVYAYCIMDNHAHLLIEVGDIKLSKVMQSIQQVYTQGYNKKHGRTGHVFEQRYKAFLCDKDNYLLELVRYIHQNPVKANIPKAITYKWSSHNEYIGQPDFTDTGFVLSLFSEKKSMAIKRYLEFMNLFGEIDDSIYARDEPVMNERYDTMSKSIKIACNLFWEKVQKYYNINLDDFKKIKLTKEERKRRATLLFLSKEITYISNKELSELFGLTPSAITKILSRIDFEDIKNEYTQLKMSICQA